MRVDPSRTAGIAPASGERQPSAGRVRPAAASDRRADAVELSESSTNMSRVRDAAAAAPDVRAERVAALRAQVQSGTYTVDSQALSGKLLDVL